MTSFTPAVPILPSRVLNVFAHVEHVEPPPLRQSIPPPSMMIHLGIAPPCVADVHSVPAMYAMFCPLTATLWYVSLAPREPAFRALSWIRFTMYCGEIA